MKKGRWKDLSCKGKSKIVDEGSVGGLIVSSEERGEKMKEARCPLPWHAVIIYFCDKLVTAVLP